MARLGNSLSALVATRQSACDGGSRLSPWVAFGVTVGVIGLCVLTLGALFLWRESAQRWARHSFADDGDALVS